MSRKPALQTAEHAEYAEEEGMQRNGFATEEANAGSGATRRSRKPHSQRPIGQGGGRWGGICHKHSRGCNFSSDFL